MALTFSRIGSGRKRGRRTERRRAPSKLWLGGGVSKTRNEPVKRINVLRGPRTTSIRCALSDLVDDPDPIRFIHPNFSLYRVAILSLSLSPLIFWVQRFRRFVPSTPELRRTLIPHQPPFRVYVRAFTLLRIVRKIIFNPPGWQVYLAIISRPFFFRGRIIQARQPSFSDN